MVLQEGQNRAILTKHYTQHPMMIVTPLQKGQGLAGFEAFCNTPEGAIFEVRGDILNIKVPNRIKHCMIWSGELITAQQDEGNIHKSYP